MATSAYLRRNRQCCCFCSSTDRFQHSHNKKDLLSLFLDTNIVVRTTACDIQDQQPAPDDGQRVDECLHCGGLHPRPDCHLHFCVSSLEKKPKAFHHFLICVRPARSVQLQCQHHLLFDTLSHISQFLQKTFYWQRPCSRRWLRSSSKRFEQKM